jgi:outer membrane protein OmpA-like peptidoglycan-associated protein
MIDRGGNIMKYLLLSSLLLASASWGKTYDFAERFGIGVNGGYTFPLHGNDFDDFAKDEVMWGLHARYHFTPEDSIQLNGSHYEFENTDINARVLDLMYMNRINEGDKFTPILGIGAGVADMDNIRPFHDGLKFASRVRAGIEYAFTDDFVGSLFADYQFIGKMPFNTEDEDDDDEAFPGREIFAVVPQIGLTYYFGPDKEIDDKKPAAQAEPITATPAVLITDTSMMDDDSDGVTNAKDKCPGTEMGNSVNAYGCLPTEKANMTLQVLFPSGGSTLGTESYPHLNELAIFMNEHPDTKLEIQGHTDSTGSKAKNKVISEKRANAIKTYLIEKSGIQPSRVSAYGYGSEKPIADNNTVEGRTQNRRVIGVITQ